MLGARAGGERLTLYLLISSQAPLAASKCPLLPGARALPCHQSAAPIVARGLPKHATPSIYIPSSVYNHRVRCSPLTSCYSSIFGISRQYWAILGNLILWFPSEDVSLTIPSNARHVWQIHYQGSARWFRCLFSASRRPQPNQSRKRQPMFIPL